MRDAFAKEITSLASERDDVTLLSGDIGNRMFDRFKLAAPERFFNCGIAEANMMSMAAGMALSGLRPVIYTITPFTTTRCLEQIRVGVAYHRAPVLIVGTGSGLSYAELGPTHHSLEDMAILRTLPGMNVVAPADSRELVIQLREALDSPNPTYMRIGKKGEPPAWGRCPSGHRQSKPAQEWHGPAVAGGRSDPGGGTSGGRSRLGERPFRGGGQPRRGQAPR